MTCVERPARGRERALARPVRRRVSQPDRTRPPVALCAVLAALVACFSLAGAGDGAYTSGGTGTGVAGASGAVAGSAGADWAPPQRRLISAGSNPARIARGLEIQRGLDERHRRFLFDDGVLEAMAVGMDRAAFPDGRVIVTYASDLFSSMLINMLLSLEQAGVGGRAFVFALDKATAGFMELMGVPHMLLPDEARRDGKCHGKFLWLLSAAALGFEMLLVEPDCFVFLDPFAFIPPKCDLAMLSDSYAWDDVQREDLNIGTFFLRSGAPAAALLGSVLEQWDGTVWDQEAVNAILRRDLLALNLTLCALDLHAWANGGLYFWLPHLAPDGAARVLVHNNFINQDWKLAMFFRAGLWLPTTESYYGGGRRYLLFDAGGGRDIAGQMHAFRLAAILARAANRTLVAPRLTCRGHPGWDLFRLRELPWCEADYWLNPGALAMGLDFRTPVLYEDERLRARYLLPIADAAALLPVGPARPFAELVAALAPYPAVFVADPPSAFDFRTVPLELAADVSKHFRCTGMRSWPKDTEEAGGVWDVPEDCWLDRHNFWRWQ